MLDESIHEFVVDLCVHDNPIGAHTDLPLVQNPPEYIRAHRNIEIRIVQDHAGIVTAKFKRDTLDLRGGHRQRPDTPTDGRGPRERDHFWNGMQSECIADLVGWTIDDVEQALWETSLFEDFRDKQTAGNGGVGVGCRDHSVPQWKG